MTFLLGLFIGFGTGFVVAALIWAWVHEARTATGWGESLQAWDGSDADVVFTPDGDWLDDRPNQNWDDYFASKEAELEPGHRVSPWLTIRGRR